MLIKIIEVIVLIILALASDIKTYKIKNSIVYPFMLIGIVTNLVLGGIEGLIFSLTGLFITILLMIILFVLRMQGAGDIKLFGAIGSIMGLKFALYTIAYSYLFGGVMALIVMLINKNGKKRLMYLINYIRSCFLSLSLLPYTDFKDKSDGAKFHFSYAIFCGTIIQLFLV